MLYTKLTKIATNIAFKAHADAIGLDGLPYICHPLHVAESMDDETSTCVALLHDVLEDTTVSQEDLRRAGMPDDIIHHIEVCTRKPQETYAQYIERVKRDPVATKVKLADLAHNLDETRLPGSLPDSLRKRYEKARKTLEEKVGKL